jgi:hypothetical protein
MTDRGDDIINYGGQDMALRDVPDKFVQNMLGYGHTNPHNRPVVVVEGRTWETTPDVCTYDDMPWDWVWVDGLQYLVCPKCGLDGT